MGTTRFSFARYTRENAHVTDEAEHVAPWVRGLTRSDQITLAGATLIIGDIKERNPGVYDDVDEVALRESKDPQTARAVARNIADPYRDHGDIAEAHRLVSLCDEIVSIIERGTRRLAQPAQFTEQETS